MLIETGCTKISPEVNDSRYMITNNNFASTAINEDKIYCGKGTTLISKKNVKTNQGKDIFNN